MVSSRGLTGDINSVVKDLTGDLALEHCWCVG